jgi:hypothetical protein
MDDEKWAVKHGLRGPRMWTIKRVRICKIIKQECEKLCYLDCSDCSMYHDWKKAKESGSPVGALDGHKEDKG